ncbi:MAG: methylaspartate ammonia-lyase [Acholeplasmataceae bacterium]|nr:methylaspartate ammonia-lyase [Acholeplasmataceae bacterium]
MKIVDVVFTKGFTGFYFDDQKAIKSGLAEVDGNFIFGQPVTKGFTNIRQAGESVSIQLILSSGQVAIGDCAAVQYSGVGGRDELFLADKYIPFLENEIKPLLIGFNVDSFKQNAEYFDHLLINNKRLHTAIRYGLSQAFLHATALKNKTTMAEVIRKEYDLPVHDYKQVDIFSQSGDDRYNNADKMIMKRVPVISHGLFNNAMTKVGQNGEKLVDYIIWLKNRIMQFHNGSYTPILHLDVYGSLDTIFNNDYEKMLNFLLKLEETAKPYKLRIEGPVDLGNQEDTLQMLVKLTAGLDAKGSILELVADEWCNTLEDIKLFCDVKAGHMIQVKTPDLGSVSNTVEALLYCKEKGIGAYCGGTCNETNVSAQVTTNIAIACEAKQILAKPGMGVDEGYMICYNEMHRVISLANRVKPILKERKYARKPSRIS